MAKRFVAFPLFIFVYFSVLPFFAIATDGSVNTMPPPDIDSWGLDVGFGVQPYMDDVSRFSVISPFVFGGSNRSGWRLSLDMVSKSFQQYQFDDILDVAISLESNGKIYKDIVYSYVKFGIGGMVMDDEMYDGTVITAPVSLGVHILTAQSQKALLSYFLEYRFMALTNYDIDKSLPSEANTGIRRNAIFSGTLSMGIRLTF